MNFFTLHFHVDINMMCLFNRLKDLQLEDCINTDKTPKIKRYWMNLKNRHSYTEGILNYYFEKELNVIDEFYGKTGSRYLNIILDEIDKKI